MRGCKTPPPPLPRTPSPPPPLPFQFSKSAGWWFMTVHDSASFMGGPPALWGTQFTVHPPPLALDTAYPLLNKGGLGAWDCVASKNCCSSFFTFFFRSVKRRCLCQGRPRGSLCGCGGREHRPPAPRVAGWNPTTRRFPSTSGAGVAPRPPTAPDDPRPSCGSTPMKVTFRSEGGGGVLGRQALQAVQKRTRGYVASPYPWGLRHSGGEGPWAHTWARARGPLQRRGRGALRAGVN